MNLLPKKYKYDLKEGFKQRFFVTSMFTIGVSFVVGTIMSLPAYFLVPKDLTEMSEGIYLENKDADSANEMLKLPEKIDFKVKFLNISMSGPSITGVLSEIVSNLPQGVALDSINFIRQPGRVEGTSPQISISGIAKNRESLVSFSETLNKSVIFSNVELPVSNLARDKDLPFSMQVTIKN